MVAFSIAMPDETQEAQVDISSVAFDSGPDERISPKALAAIISVDRQLIKSQT